METPYHLRPEHCYVCGCPKHAPRAHNFWSNADAAKEMAAQPATTTTPEADYVATYRPY